MACSLEVQRAGRRSGRGPFCIETGERTFRWFRRLGRQDLALGGRSPRRRARSRPHPRSGALLSTASRPRNLSRWCALSRSGRQRRGRLRPCSRREEQCRRGGPGRCLTRKGPEVTVRSTSPSSAVCAGLLGDRARQGEEVYAEPRSRWSTRPGDGSDTQGEIRETPGAATRAGRKSMRKVRTEP